MDYRLYVPSVPAAARQDWEAIDLLSATSGATDVCGAPINPQEQGDDVGIIIARDAVTVHDDREVEVEGQAQSGYSRDTGRGDTVTCGVTPNALWHRCSHVESRRAKCSDSPAVWAESGLGETTTWSAPYANGYANQPDSGGVRGCTPMYVKRSDLQKLDTHEHQRTPCLNLGDMGRGAMHARPDGGRLPGRLK
ncbi:MAG: hypothetical protein ABWY20_23120 [Mycobacterium sp.]